MKCGTPRFDPWVEKILWRRKWQPTTVFLLGKSHGQRSLVGYSPWGCKESDTTGQLHTHTHTHTYTVLKVAYLKKVYAFLLFFQFRVLYTANNSVH